jgi:hypothetical protein
MADRSLSTRFKLIEGSQGSAFNKTVSMALEVIEDADGDIQSIGYGFDRGKHHAGIQYTVPVDTPQDLLDSDDLSGGTASPMQRCETSDPKEIHDARGVGRPAAPVQEEAATDAPLGTRANPKRIAAS